MYFKFQSFNDGSKKFFFRKNSVAAFDKEILK